MIARSPITTITPEQASKLVNDSTVVFLEVSVEIPQLDRNLKNEYQKSHIPTARLFDLDTIANQTSSLPHMMPQRDDFRDQMQDLGINRDDLIICYDRLGLICSARAWWMFRHFGHNNVTVLAGGLPRWESEGYGTTSRIDEHDKGDFIAAPPLTAAKQVYSLMEMESQAQNNLIKIIDVRSPGRYDGSEEEIWPGRARGHIPTSVNIPFPNFLTSDGDLKSNKELEEIFEKSGVARQDRLVASCGSGVTACILALAAVKAGFTVAGIYDGSWAEYGLKRANKAQMGPRP